MFLHHQGKAGIHQTLILLLRKHQAFHNYVLELDDATKVLNDKDGNPVNFGEMPLDKFLEARSYIDSGNLENILEMK